MSKKLKKNREEKPLFTIGLSSPPHQSVQSTSNKPSDESCISNVNANLNEKNYADLDPKLTKLKDKVGKLFKNEFVDSLIYLIRLEYNPQSKFEQNLAHTEWKKLDYLIQQLKKICKNKKHIIALINVMKIDEESSSHQHAQKKNTSNCSSNAAKFSETPKLKKNTNELLEAIYDYSNLINEIDNFDGYTGEYFSLTSIMIRFLYKLLKTSLNADMTKQVVHEEVKIIEMCLILLSCLADFCFHEEIRLQVNFVSNCSNFILHSMSN